MAGQDAFDAEEFWEDLLAFIEDRRVLPIVGADLLTIEVEGRAVAAAGWGASRRHRFELLLRA